MQNQRLPHFGAFESTSIHGSGEDVLSTSRHLALWEADLNLLLGAGLNELRYPIPWHRIEREEGHFDFAWLDGPMRFMQQHKMHPIVDPLHHTSFPDWLEGGFSDPVFPERYIRFLTEVLERYPWIDRVTVFNEPLATTILCGEMGIWYPHGASDPAFVHMVMLVSKAICLASRFIHAKSSRTQLVRVDTCEYHHALDQNAEPWAKFCNERRFMFDDLTTGRVNTQHPLFAYLTKNGASKEDLQWLLDNPAEMAIFGLDYYPPSEMDWRWDASANRPTIAWPVSSPRGFAAVARDYSNRYHKPLMLSETNVRGTVSDRVTWLRHMEEQCELLIDKGVDLRGFCWFPSIDSTDWDYLCTRCNASVDPQGIWWLDDCRWTRHVSELSSWYGQLATGRVVAADLPAYQFLPPLDRDLAGYVKLMKHWDGWTQTQELAA